MHGFITTGEYCSNPATPIVPVKSGDVEPVLSSAGSLFRVYPNPTTGEFTLDISNVQGTGKAVVDIFGIRGEKVFSTELPGSGKYELSLSGKPLGVYVIRVIYGNSPETLRIIKK